MKISIVRPQILVGLPLQLLVDNFSDFQFRAPHHVRFSAFPLCTSPTGDMHLIPPPTLYPICLRQLSCRGTYSPCPNSPTSLLRTFVQTATSLLLRNLPNRRLPYGPCETVRAPPLVRHHAHCRDRSHLSCAADSPKLAASTGSISIPPGMNNDATKQMTTATIGDQPAAEYAIISSPLRVDSGVSNPSGGAFAKTGFSEPGRVWQKEELSQAQLLRIFGCVRR